MHEPRLHRIQVQHAEGFTGNPVDHDIVHLGIVVHHADRQLPGNHHFRKHGRQGPPAGNEVPLYPGPRGPARSVPHDGVVIRFKVARCVMKPRERITEAGRREVRNQRLKPTEPPAHLIGMMNIFDLVENDAVFNIMKNPPAGAGAVNMMRTTAPGVDQRRRYGKGVHHPLCAQSGYYVPRHRFHVLHHVNRALEHRGIDALEHILADRIAVPERTEIGIVDQSGAEFFNRRKRAGNRKAVDNVFGPLNHAAL